MGLSTFIELGKTAAQGKQAMDSFNPQTATALGKKAATAPLKVWENIPRWVVRGLQLLLGLIVVALYGHRVDADRKAGNAQVAEWVFGVAVASMSCITAVVFALAAPLGAVSDKFKTYRLFAWDVVLFVLWIILFGVMGMIFLKRDDGLDYKGASTSTMKKVVWLDLVNSILWMASGVYGFVKKFLGAKVDSVGGRVAGRLFGKKAQPAKEVYEV
ncbi:hypothetical protein QBC33DRAFT_548909 [Phialemonium atrogriseum]|uniref:MARVEL domain-containing protein n=1 Tax=Phialemonium atrogriseum TaxID=1093897 RepID=A0AAJ0BTD5_9PEZI|nr:uncharacterized protein QBC33DRAFT_548909 [Phialemonium atrogriseum]KAK1763667.1 hypothetical protein QBC33DRAFT_548909 [Phialemonium atrogriseum]